MGTVWRHINWLAGGLALDSLETYYLVSWWISMGTVWRHITWSDGGIVWGQFGDILSGQMVGKHWDSLETYYLVR